MFSCGVNQEVDQAGGYVYKKAEDAHGDVTVDPSNTNINKSDPKDIPFVDTRQGESVQLLQL